MFSFRRCCTALSLLALSTAQQISFTQSDGGDLLASSSSAARIYVDANDLYGVRRAAGDLAMDFGRVTGQNGTLVSLGGNGTSGSGNSTASQYGNSTGSALPVVVGTLNDSSIIGSLVSGGQLDVSAIQGQWESYIIQTVQNVPGVGNALVVAGADKRGAIFGIYDLSEQMGVSAWHFWADVGSIKQSSVYSTSTAKTQGSPTVKYRGIFINDEQPALTNWVLTQWPDLPNGSAAFNNKFYALLFELMLRLRANYLWPASWGSMFYVDDPTNGKTANDFGIVMGSSHTEPLARATNEQANPQFMQGPWAWTTNQANVTEFLRQGVQRAQNYETLWTMGMRGKGDVASPSLNATTLEAVVLEEQQLLREVLNKTDLTDVPQMWCLYKEVGGYFAQGMTVPDDITLLWAEDNWGNAQRLPIANETQRSGGSGIYYHVDYVGDPRDYKWINTISLQKSWSELTQAYDRGAQRIWILNVGDLKNLEVPIQHFLDMAYNITAWQDPSSNTAWLTQWAGKNFGQDAAESTAEIMTNYSMLAARRKYELVDPTVYSLINYNEADTVLSQWASIANAAQAVYDKLDPAVQPGYFEMVLHPAMAGYTVYQIHISAAKNNLYTLQGRTSANTWASKAIAYFNQDHSLTQRYHDLLGGKWNHILDQTHLGYSYWQQPYRNSIPPLGYVQTQERSLGGDLGVSAEANNGTVPGDDQFHSLSSNVLSLPPMDPYGPATRWIDLFSRGINAVQYSINSSHPAVSISQPTGMLDASGNSTDQRVYVSVDWSKVTNSSAMATLKISANSDLSDTGFINATRHQYGSTSAPSVTVMLNKTSVPSDFHGFVESDKTISIEASHYTTLTNTSSSANSTYLQNIPNYGRTLSGVALKPNNAPSQDATASTPHLSYDIYTFTPTSMANITAYLGTALNTYPGRPLRYAVAIDGGNVTVVQPIPTTNLGTLPPSWGAMVGNAAAMNVTRHDMSTPGKHTVDFWLLEPGLVLQKLVVDLGGVRQSYLGPPESMIV